MGRCGRQGDRSQRRNALGRMRYLRRNAQRVDQRKARQLERYHVRCRRIDCNRSRRPARPGTPGACGRAGTAHHDPRDSVSPGHAEPVKTGSTESTDQAGEHRPRSSRWSGRRRNRAPSRRYADSRHCRRPCRDLRASRSSGCRDERCRGPASPRLHLTATDGLTDTIPNAWASTTSQARVGSS